MPSYFKKLKKNKSKNNIKKKKSSRKINKKNKSKNKNKKPNIIEISTEKIVYSQTRQKNGNISESENYNDSEYLSSSNHPPFENPQSREKSNKKNNQLKSKPPKQKNICKYAFILSKSPEYGNCIMYITGSIPQLGKWNEKEAIAMDEEIKNMLVFFTKYIDVKKEEFPFEYKYFFIKDGRITLIWKSNINYK